MTPQNGFVSFINCIPLMMIWWLLGNGSRWLLGNGCGSSEHLSEAHQIFLDMLGNLFGNILNFGHQNSMTSCTFM